MRAASALDYRELARRRLPHFLFVVSNHGGRQLDGTPSTAAEPPPIADAVRDRLTMLADGGVLGRAWVYALAAVGGRGVTHMLQLVEAEMRVGMALTSCTNIASITRDILVQSKYSHIMKLLSLSENKRLPYCGQLCSM